MEMQHAFMMRAINFYRIIAPSGMLSALHNTVELPCGDAEVEKSIKIILTA
jgi:hypothetical protein